jgi:hypothetical protein
MHVLTKNGSSLSITAITVYQRVNNYNRKFDNAHLTNILHDCEERHYDYNEIREM